MTDNNLGESPALAEEPTQATEVTNVAQEAPEGAEPAPAKQESSEDKIQKRFDKLTKEKYDAQRRADRLEWELSQIKSQPAKTPQVAPEIPTLEGSGFDDAKYQAAVIEYAKQVARAEAAEALKQEREQQQVQAKASEFDKRQAEFAKANPDYAEKVTNNPDLPITEHMAKAIRKDELGPAIAYYLAEHEEIAAAIAGLQDPIDQAVEIGSIRALLKTQKAAPKVSQAPPPPAKLDAVNSSVAKAATDPESDKLSDAEWMRLRNKQVTRRG